MLHMDTTNGNAKMANATVRHRYMSVKLEGHETYVEDVDKTARLDLLCKAGRERLALIRQAMPRGDWSITVEQKMSTGQYEIFDCETGKAVAA